MMLVETSVERVFSKPMLDSAVDEPSEKIRRNESPAPLFVVVCRGLARHDFTGRDPSLLKLCHTVTHFAEHLFERKNVFAESWSAVTAHTDCRRSSECQVFVAGGNHAIDTSATVVIDEGIESIEKCVSGVKYIGIAKKHRYIRVGMGRCVTRQFNPVPIRFKGLRYLKGDCRYTIRIPKPFGYQQTRRDASGQ